MALGEILRERREELQLTLDEVSGRVGCSKPYLSTIETRKVKNPPSDPLLVKLERVLEFEEGDLLHLAHMERMSPDVRQQFEKAEAENERWREIVKRVIKQGVSRKKFGRLPRGKASGKVVAGRLVPIINRVAAGYPADFDDLDYPAGIADDYVRCPDVHDPNAFAVRVVGDSMEPKFKEGDIVIFSPALEVHSGDDCFVRFSSPHETTFKRVFFEKKNEVRLQPRNDRYAPQIVDGRRINGMYRAMARYERF